MENLKELANCEIQNTNGGYYGYTEQNSSASDSYEWISGFFSGFAAGFHEGYHGTKDYL